MADTTDESRSPLYEAFSHAADMEKEFYTRREIAHAFRKVAEELDPDR